jgi:hypothetical protein
VRIELREPGFELRIGPRAEPFLAGYDVTADNREQAARLAVAKLNHDALMSSVGWSRVIERVIIGESPIPARVWSAEGGFVTEGEPAGAVPEAAAPAVALAEAVEPQPVVLPEPEIEPTPSAPEPASWTALHTVAVLAGVGLGLYLGVRAARLRDAA